MKITEIKDIQKLLNKKLVVLKFTQPRRNVCKQIKEIQKTKNLKKSRIKNYHEKTSCQKYFMSVSFQKILE